MTTEKKEIRIIISGGGTGGHLFPAIAIANAVKRLEPAAEILFVGAEGRMEMKKVPEAGYRIEGLPVAGFVRSFSLKNVSVVIRLIKSMFRARSIIRSFRPDVAVGVGGYASGPVLKEAQRMGIPTLIQEQNSYAGVTNRLLARKADRICVAYDAMEKYFPAEKIMKTGNPVRQAYITTGELKREACDHFGLRPGVPVVLVLGGSLGAGTVNDSIGGGMERFAEAGVQVLWQTGSGYFDRMKALADSAGLPNITVTGFINRMDLAYAAADIIISRAGAGTISELAIVGKPVILVPSPNVAEDHQTHNAMALVEKVAALLVTDSTAQNELVSAAIALVNDPNKRTILSENIKKFAISDADTVIAGEAIKLARK